MKLDISFTNLDALRRNMQAPLTPWNSNVSFRGTENSFGKALEGGLEVKLPDVEPGTADLLTYKGRQVLLYIYDTYKEKNTLLYESERAPRFHFANCKTLQKMRRDKKFDRYVVATREDGKFNVESQEEDGSHIKLEAGLHVCKNCLKHINYKKYADYSMSQKKEIWLNFSISNFFEHCNSSIFYTPKYTDQTVPAASYTDDWCEVSLMTRQKAQWTCNECRVNLTNHKRLLHTHHINGVKGDNSIANLRALCAECHGKQPGHAHMKITQEDLDTLRKLR